VSGAGSRVVRHGEGLQARGPVPGVSYSPPPADPVTFGFSEIRSQFYIPSSGDLGLPSSVTNWPPVRRRGGRPESTAPTVARSRSAAVRLRGRPGTGRLVDGTLPVELYDTTATR
jgi:hypothetical protein